METAEEVNNCLHNIKETFGPGKKCLGKDWRINFNEKELQTFLEKISQEKRLFLSRLIAFFWYYMRPLYQIQTSEDSLDKVLGKTVWSTFALVTIMSVLDHYTKGVGYKRKEFVEILLENIPINSEKQLKELSESHKKMQPHSSIKRLCDLFKNNLEPEDIERITEYYLREKRIDGKLKINTFEEVIGHLWGEIRSDFIHNVGIESIGNESTIFSVDKSRSDTFVVYNNLSMSNLLFLSWKAIFRDMGYKAEINANFTTEEIKKRLTEDGTTI